MSIDAYNPADTVRAIMIDLVQHGVALTFGPASTCRATELAASVLRQFGVMAVWDDEPADESGQATR